MIDIQLIEADILESLRHDAARRSAASRARDYYDLDVRAILDRHFHRREFETYIDFENRPKRMTAVTQSAINTLCKHLYNPGPSRLWPEPIGNQFLEYVYKTNQINALMKSADRMATLHGAAAVGVSVARDGRLRLDVFGGDEFTIWCPDDDPEYPDAICIGSPPLMTLWTDTEIRKYSCKVEQKPTLASVEPNPYGRIPFAFFHSVKPVRSFWDGEIGAFVASVNCECDREMSDIADFSRYSQPIGVSRNMGKGARVMVKPGYFNNLPTSVAGGQSGELAFVQAQFDAPSRVQAVMEWVYSALESIGVPRSAVRVDPIQATSGIALICEQIPLLTRAMERQPLFGEYESRLARLLLLIGSVVYNQPNLLASAEMGPLVLTWPPPPLPIPMPERLDEDQILVDQGRISRVMLTQQRLNVTEAEAIEYLKKVAEHEAMVASFAATPTSPAAKPQELADPDPTLTDEGVDMYE